ncbi:translocation/assembly module TamB domain-containing protein [Shewanella sp. SG41-3]|uniref:autotransporter assembly complex protein TamB n=1 Tax=Shewanella sp. SG41-3 TaxID=2760977 RepID=UPI0015FF5C81|nr:translocation/assembly module TamB domain-containing protein [Shewanella sp. SG41-3]MBB1477332.1 translocation/assembly module TamB domain-containing protein [Shewanella sp. SG41-3]
MTDEHSEQGQQPQATAANNNTKTKRATSLPARIWRQIKLYTRILIYVPLALLMLFAVLIGTPFGSKTAVFLVNQLVSDVEVEYASGTLNGDLTLHSMSWSMPGISVNAQNVTLEWVPTCLMNKQLCVTNLMASSIGVNIVSDNIPAAKDADKSTELPAPFTKFELPINISLSQAKLTQVDIAVNSMTFHADELSTQAIWNSAGLMVESFTSQGLIVDIPAAPASTKPINVPVESIQTAQTVDAKATAWPLANLPQVFMPFPIDIRQFNATDSLLKLGERTDHFNHIALAASFRQFQLGISQLDIQHDDGNVSVSGDIALHDHYPLALTLTANVDNLPELPGLKQQQLSLELSEDLSQLHIDAIAKGDSHFNLTAKVDLTSPALDYQVTLTDAALQWPLSNPLYTSNISRFTSKGDSKDQVAQFEGQITTPYHPPLTVSADIVNVKQKLTVNKLKVQSLAGNVELTGELSYQDNITWQAKVFSDNIQLQYIDYINQQNPVKSKFSGHFNSSGSLADKQWQVAIEQANLTGRLNGYPLNLQGDISLNQDFAVNASNLQANALGAQLIVNGQADKIWDINAELSVPDVSQWLTGARGSIFAKVDVSGNSADPIVDVNAQINKLSYQGSKIDNLNLLANYRPYLQHQYRIELHNNNLVWSSYKLTDISFISEGNQSKQQSKLNTQGDLVVNTQISSSSNIDKQQFNATLTEFSISNVLGQWQQDKPITANWDQLNHRGSISSFCLVHPHNKLCLINDVNLGHTGQANITLTGNPGKTLEPILSKKINWSGEAALTSQVNWAKAKKPTANLQFTLLPGNIKLSRTKNNTISIDYQQLLLQASLDEKKVTSSLSFDSSGIASWQSQLSVNITPDRTLQGTINVNELNLAPFGEFFPRLETLEGMLSSRLMLSGTLMDPSLSGNIKLNDAALALSTNPTLIDKLYLSLSLEGQQGQLNGQWHMGDGQVTTQGTLAWPQGKFSGDIDIKGSNLAVIQPPMAILNVSPDINMTFDDQLFAIKGKVNVPSGQIKITPLAEGGIAVSNDVVFNDSVSQQTVKTSPYAITADLNINVGKNLTIDGMGLKGKLEGDLVLQQQAFKPPMLFGDIRVNKGTYKFMGQTLTINTGEVQFIGPTASPNLNIEATREIKESDITAGVRVTGTPMRPVVTLFSNPAKEQAEILSYILTGKGFTSSSNQQSNSLMMGAALSLGSQFDGGAMNSIGSTATGLIEKFGFSNVQLDTNDDGKVAVSGYIGEDLMIKYGVGVFNPGYEMTVRYYLFSQLYLESVSSTLSQSLDIYYSFEID